MGECRYLCNPHGKDWQFNIMRVHTSRPIHYCLLTPHLSTLNQPVEGNDLLVVPWSCLPLTWGHYDDTIGPK